MIALAMAVVVAAPITLGEVRQASRQNLDALKTEIALRQATAGVTLAKSFIYPQLQIGAQAQGYLAGAQRVYSTIPQLGPNNTVTYENTSVDVPGANRANFQLALTVTQLLYDGGKWWNNISQAGANELAAQGQLEEQRLVSELEAVSRFYTLLNAQTSLGVMENSVRRSQTQVERAKGLFEAGRGSKFDAIDAEVNLGTDRMNLLKQKQLITAAQVALLQWLGLPQKPIEAVDPGTLDPKVAPAPAPGAETALNEAKKSRPLMRALDQQIVSAQRGVDVQWAQYMPQVALQGGYQRQSPAADLFFTDPSKQNVLWGGLNLTWNAFSGFGTQAQVVQAREGVIQAQLTRERAGTDLEGDVRRAIEALNTNIEVASIAEANLTLSRSSLSLAEERFTAGAGSTLEVRDAQVKVTAAELAYLQARVDVEVARAGLHRVIGSDIEAEGRP
jgi:outer membrane protein TolC